MPAQARESNCGAANSTAPNAAISTAYPSANCCGLPSLLIDILRRCVVPLPQSAEIMQVRSHAAAKVRPESGPQWMGDAAGAVPERGL
ncbi:hypothetical protein GCM10010199_51590 [Dactylosporangium roseum]